MTTTTTTTRRRIRHGWFDNQGPTTPTRPAAEFGSRASPWSPPRASVRRRAAIVCVCVLQPDRAGQRARRSRDCQISSARPCSAHEPCSLQRPTDSRRRGGSICCGVMRVTPPPPPWTHVSNRPAARSGANVAVTVVIWVLWLGVTLVADFLAFLMFAFADSPGSAGAAQAMIVPVFAWFGFTFVAGVVLLILRRTWQVVLAFALAA